MTDSLIVDPTQNDSVSWRVLALVSSFLGGVLLLLAGAKLLDFHSIMTRPDSALYLSSAALELLAGGLLLLKPQSRLGWFVSLALGLAFALYAWIDNTPVCRCLGAFRDLDRQERYLIAILIAALSCLGLALTRVHSK